MAEKLYHARLIRNYPPLIRATKPVEGYIVPGIQNVGSKAGKEIELRYCENRGQPTDVDHIRDLLAREKIAVAKARVLKVLNVPSCANVSTARSYELWLGSDFTNYK